MKIFITVLVIVLLIASFISTLMYAYEVYKSSKRAKKMEELNSLIKDINNNKS